MLLLTAISSQVLLSPLV